MHPGAPARVQACHKACPLPQASYRVCRYPQGGVLQVKNEPKKGPEASYQEVVLRTYCRVWLGRIGGSGGYNTIKFAKTISTGATLNYFWQI